jgi:DNA polymerase
MGFVTSANITARKRDPLFGLSERFLAASSCSLCPLKLAAKVPPSGVEAPRVYILGEAPGKVEADEGIPFVGRAGQLLRSAIPRAWRDKVRFNNVIKSHPPLNRDPDQLEIACCRGSLVEDIEAAQPFAIFGFGNFALNSLLVGQSGIMRMSGRHCPIKVGQHTCYFFAFLHPSYILRLERDRDSGEINFRREIRQAFELLDTLPDPHVDTAEEALEDVRVSYDAQHILRAGQDHRRLLRGQR